MKRSRGFVTVSIAGTLLLAACNDGGETDPSNPPVPTNHPRHRVGEHATVGHHAAGHHDRPDDAGADHGRHDHADADHC